MVRIPSFARILREVPLGLLFLLLAMLTLGSTRLQGGPAVLALASPLLFARLSMLPRRRWPAPIVSCFLAECGALAVFGTGPVLAGPVASIIVAEAITATWLIRRMTGTPAFLDSLRGILAFAVVAGVIVPALSGVTVWLVIGAMRGAMPPWWACGTWFAAHGLGMLVFTPVFLMAMRGDLRRGLSRATPRQRGEALGLIAIVAAVSVAAFAQSRLPLLFVPALPIMATTLRLGRAGAAISIVLLAGIGAVFTVRDQGPISLAGLSDAEDVQLLQLYLATMTLLVLPVAALLRQYRDLLRRLSESEARYRLMAERSADAILTIGLDSTILYASPAVKAIAGYEPADLVNRSIADLIHPDDLPIVLAARTQAHARPADMVSIEYRAHTAHGELRWFQSSIRAVVDGSESVTGSVSAIRDVTSRKADEARLAADAETDELTGLPNRRAFMRALDAAHRRARIEDAHASVALFDIDLFKSVNDRFGHAAGDAVLVAFAQTARGALRDGDCLARIGGEEFGLILSVADDREAERACERLRRLVSHMIVPIDGGGSVRITVSAGVATLCPDAEADTALKEADAALYRAKAEGRDRLVPAA